MTQKHMFDVFFVLVSSKPAFWPLLARDLGGLAFEAPNDPETCVLARVSLVRYPHLCGPTTI